MDKIIYTEPSKLFNTPMEIGLRILFIFAKFSPQPLSIDKLICFDYFLIHSGDVKNGPKSLHPKYPYRSTEIIIKRDLLKEAIKYLISKELLQIKYCIKGIEYCSTDIGNKVIEYFESKYAIQLRKMSDWIYEVYSNASEDDLWAIINTNLSKWGAEFTNENIFRGKNE